MMINLKRLLDTIRKYDRVAGLQLLAFGRQSLDFTKPVLAPSAIPCPITKQLAEDLGFEYQIREMTLDEIRIVKEDYIASAVRAEKAGAQLIELNAAHGYLLNQFLSPYSNVRTDQYGGSVENRVRLLREILEGVKSSVSNDVIIVVRVSCEEFVKGGLHPSDYKEILPILEKAGMDLLNISVAVLPSMEKLYPFIYSGGKEKKPGEAPYLDLACELKKYTNVPTCYCSFVSSPETVEKIVSEGKSDFVAMGRAQMADQNLVKKTIEGKENEIVKCVYDDKCLFFMTGLGQVYCTVNKKYPLPKKNK